MTVTELTDKALARYCAPSSPIEFFQRSISVSVCEKMVGDAMMRLNLEGVSPSS